MNKFVENPVDNSEDNRVENNQDPDSQIPMWIEQWSRYVLQSSSVRGESAALDLIQAILLASMRGESCISVSDSNPEILGNLIINHKLAMSEVAPFVYDAEHLYLYRYWQLEQRLATQVHRILQQPINQVDAQEFEYLLPDAQQKQALQMVTQQALSIITGGPGTGKTYTLARIIAVLNHAIPDLRIAMAAPTGKAAQRMKEALLNSLNDEKLQALGLINATLSQQDTVTIHRLLGLGYQTAARFNAKHPLPYDVIVIDEASMLDLQLATLLLEAVPAHCRVILLGDAQQLASVDVGSVLADLQQLACLQANRVHLLTSRRFKEGALIGRMAGFIQMQQQTDFDAAQLLRAFERDVVPATTLQPIKLNTDMADVIQLEYLADHISQVELFDYYEKLAAGYADYWQCLGCYATDDDPATQLDDLVKSFDQYRILTAIHFGSFGLTALNREMEAALLQHLPLIVKQGDWYLGRPIMMTHNDYQLGLSNGDIGICVQHRTQAGQFEVYFPTLQLWVAATRLPKSIQTAFAMTIHKSQGSEFKHVAVVFNAQAEKLLSQELIYTAITRAKSVVSLLVDGQTFAKSLFVRTTRKSGLVEKIQALD
ncbi:DNA helicase/exodeoxyribonuclease V alpha subunit [Acinetobacter calcoaceticus]|uniref:RecBCD enzyme subunit RecD n=1 Tax=Acinetobacter calcoaceticus TaxID=471 RepID=A0A4V2R238_ACICA|nr:DNA helicase/exodeoxyribonuclease V alpha subunit [Acinetobacter calcoaceticus]